MLSTRQMRREWAEYECSTLDWTTIEFLGRSTVKTIKRLVDAWSAAERVLIDHEYVRASIVGSYACRDIRGGTGRSLHAYRLALDIDPSLNGRQGKGATMDWDRCRVTIDQVLAIEAIRTTSGAQVFRNGYVFSNPDPMHFQIACTKADIDSGIDWVASVGGEPHSTIGTHTSSEHSAPAAGSSTVPQSKDETLFCAHGDGIDNTDRDDTVRYWQTKLAALGQDTGGIDGRYGDKTRIAVQAVVPGSQGMRIGGEEAAHIDIALATLGHDAARDVRHQHEEYAPAHHDHND